MKLICQYVQWPKYLKYLAKIVLKVLQQDSPNKFRIKICMNDISSYLPFYLDFVISYINKIIHVYQFNDVIISCSDRGRRSTNDANDYHNFSEHPAWKDPSR